MNPKNGEGCIRNPNERRDPQTNSSEDPCSDRYYTETVQKIKELLTSLLHEYMSSKQGRNVRQEYDLKDTVIYDSEMPFDTLLHKGISEIIKQGECWSSYGLSNRNSLICAPFHIVFALGDLAGISYFPKLDNEAMKELTRHWAICHPKKTLIIAPNDKLEYMKKSWSDWTETYKSWGGEVDFFDVTVKAMGWNVSVGAVTKL